MPGGETNDLVHAQACICTCARVCVCVSLAIDSHGSQTKPFYSTSFPSPRLLPSSPQVGRRNTMLECGTTANVVHLEEHRTMCSALSLSNVHTHAERLLSPAHSILFFRSLLLDSLKVTDGGSEEHWDVIAVRGEDWGKERKRQAKYRGI